LLVHLVVFNLLTCLALSRYAAGVKNILDSYFSGREDYRPEDLIVHKGDYATKAYGQRDKK
jgi:formate dehydrogenase